MFYEQELLKTKQNDLYIIEKVIKKVGNKYLINGRITLINLILMLIKMI